MASPVPTGWMRRHRGRWRSPSAQGGEFAFVIFGVAATYGLLGHGFADRLIAVVTLSMAATPLLFALNARLTEKLKAAKAVGSTAYDRTSGRREPGDHRRLRPLRADRRPHPRRQADPLHRPGTFGRTGGFRPRSTAAEVYYGDASRLDLLHAAKADKAEIFVLAIDDVEASLRTAETVTKNFPHLKIYARARNRAHAYRLMELGIPVVWRETFLSSLDMARHVLEGLGLPDYEAERVAERFRVHDEQRLYGHFGEHQDEKRMQVLAKKAAEELRDLFAEDAEQRGGKR